MYMHIFCLKTEYIAPNGSSAFFSNFFNLFPTQRISPFSQQGLPHLLCCKQIIKHLPTSRALSGIYPSVRTFLFSYRITAKTGYPYLATELKWPVPTIILKDKLNHYNSHNFDWEPRLSVYTVSEEWAIQ